MARVEESEVSVSAAASFETLALELEGLESSKIPLKPQNVAFLLPRGHFIYTKSPNNDENLSSSKQALLGV